MVWFRFWEDFCFSLVGFFFIRCFAFFVSTVSRFFFFCIYVRVGLETVLEFIRRFLGCCLLLMFRWTFVFGFVFLWKVGSVVV